MPRPARLALGAVIVLAFGLPGTATAAVGASGVGDPYFPFAGNGGIDVQDYALDLSYAPSSRVLTGRATLTIRATQALSRFDLDLRGFTIPSAITVDGAAATFTRGGVGGAQRQELVITPARTIPNGALFTVVVPYTGVPETVVDPDDSSEGWVPTADGAVVVGEPQGSPAWYPANDHPSDKATYSVAMSVPDGLTAVGNGALISKVSAGGRTTFSWRERFAMAPYLATITLGRFDVTEGRSAGGVPTYVAVDPKLANSAASSMSKVPAMVDFLASVYGPYPFENAGAIVDDAPQLGYSLETQTKPVYAASPDEVTVLHELSHMWFGDAVTLRRWQDIWLHEGFATWSEWYWTERQGNKTAAQQFKQMANTTAKDTAFWNPPPGDPGGPENLFDGTIYDRGGMTLEALRERIGDTAFFRILREWYSANRYSNVSTPAFVALAERVSGQELSAFFQEWLYTPGKPAGLADGAAVAGTARRR